MMETASRFTQPFSGKQTSRWGYTGKPLETVDIAFFFKGAHFRGRDASRKPDKDKGFVVGMRSYLFAAGVDVPGQKAVYQTFRPDQYRQSHGRQSALVYLYGV
jgi:hypothetical protein